MMFPNLRSLFLLCFGGVLIFASNTMQANPPNVLNAGRPLQQQDLRGLLDDGWIVSIRGYQDAQQRTEQLERITEPDQRLGYAALLIELKQRKYTAAEQSLKRLLQEHPNYLPLWRVRIWLSVVTRKYQAAQAEIQLLGQLVAQGSLQTDAPQGAGLVQATEDQVLELLDWVGQLVGFVEGPANTGIRPIVFQQRRTTLQQRWNDPQWEAFEQGRKSVLKSFAAHQLATEKIQKETEVEVRNLLQELDQKQQSVRKDLKKRRKDINEQKKELRDELREQQRLLREEDRPLTDTLWRLGSQENTVWRTRSFFVMELQWLERQLATEVDPILRQQLISEIERLNHQLMWTGADLASLQNQSWNVQRTRTGLYSQHRQDQQLVNQLIKSSQESLEKVDRNERRSDVIINRERRKAQTKNGTVRVAEGKSTSLRSYLTFPLELEKLRLLNSF